jgi:hypothetical protein
MTSPVKINIAKMESTFSQLITSALIDAYHSESILWDTGRNASEEENELAWLRIAKLFNPPPTRFAGCFRITAQAISTGAECAS